MFKYLILLGICTQLAIANVQNDLKNLKIPEMIELPDNITSELPSEDLFKVLSEKCKKNGGEKAAKDAMEAKDKLMECVKGLVDFSKLQDEIEQAKPKGDLDYVFNNYCLKTPSFKQCITNFTKELQPCFEDKEKSTVTTVLNVTEQLAQFICHKEGDRIALFVAEGGFECINASGESIRNCINTIFKKDIPTSGSVGLEELPLLLLTSEQCENFYKLQICVVKELERCKEPTPANIVDSLFNFVKKATPCASYKFAQTANTPSKSPSTYSFLTVFIVFLCSFTVLRLSNSH